MANRKAAQPPTASPQSTPLDEVLADVLSINNLLDGVSRKLLETHQKLLKHMQHVRLSQLDLVQGQLQDTVNLIVEVIGDNREVAKEASESPSNQG